MIWLLQYVASLVDVLRRPWLGVVGLAVLVALFVGFYGWLLLPVASGWQVAGNAIIALLLIGALVFALMLAYRRFDASRGFLRSLRSPRVWLALPLAVLFGVWIPWRILDHVRFFEGFWAQATAVALRFLVASLLMVTSALWFISVAAWTARNAMEEASGHDKDVDATQ